MRLLRLTRHTPEPLQLQELERILGPGLEIRTVAETMPTDTREFVARFDELARDADVVEAVLPIALLEATLKFTAFGKAGKLLIRAVMNRASDEQGNATFRFDHYERVVKVEVATEQL